MIGGLINVVLGGGMVIGGATGKLVFMGTGSPTPIIVIGAVLVGLGAFRIYRSTKKRA